ncbi:MAG TPA: hypothetical protein VII08_16245, partial [Myxococcales bacterium]
MTGSYRADTPTSGHVFAKAGVYTQQCSMHPEMLAYIFVGTTAYSAVVDRDGRFSIPDVPP